MTKTKADGRLAYNVGYRDAINGIPAENPGDFYYMMGHAEGWPKRLVPTYITSHLGTKRVMCSLERTTFYMARNTTMPGGRR